MSTELSVDLFYQADLVDDTGNDPQMVYVLHFYPWSLPRFFHGPTKYLNSRR